MSERLDTGRWGGVTGNFCRPREILSFLGEKEEEEEGSVARERERLDWEGLGDAGFCFGESSRVADPLPLEEEDSMDPPWASQSQSQGVVTQGPQQALCQCRRGGRTWSSGRGVVCVRERSDFGCVFPPLPNLEALSLWRAAKLSLVENSFRFFELLRI